MRIFHHKQKHTHTHTRARARSHIHTYTHARTHARTNIDDSTRSGLLTNQIAFVLHESLFKYEEIGSLNSIGNYIVNISKLETDIVRLYKVYIFLFFHFLSFSLYSKYFLCTIVNEQKERFCNQKSTFVNLHQLLQLKSSNNGFWWCMWS